MSRLPHWERALSEYIAESQAGTYAYGSRDCALFAAGAVIAMTGNDPAGPFRGRYTTAKGAVRALRRIGAGSLEATLNARFERREPAFAQRGDLTWNGEAVGVCMGAYALFVADEGLTRVPRADWRGAWVV